MKIIKPLNQSLLHKVFEDRKRCCLSVGILGFFPYDSGSGLLHEIRLWKFVPDELGETTLDTCMPKSGAEVLLSGKCFAPQGKPIPASKVRLQLGPIYKTLYVFGDRFWKNKAGFFKTLSDPEPFTETAIAYENAFGGPDFKENPLGKGHAPVELDDGRPCS